MTKVLRFFDKNFEWLQPHKRFLDLAIIVRKNFDPDNEAAIVSTVISDAVVEAYDLDVEEMFEVAMKNTKETAGFQTISMSKYLSGVEGRPEELYKNGGPELTICTNRHMVNGASVLAFPEFLQDFAESQEADLWILPSSIHEILLLSKPDTVAPDGLEEIVRHANCTVTAKEDFLSAHVFEYNREDKEVRIAV